MLRSLAQHAEDAGVGRKTIPASCTGAMCCERTPFACQPPLQRRIRSVRAPAARRLAAAAAHHLSADTQCGRLRGPCCWYCTVPVHRPPCCGPLRSCILRAGLGMRRPASHHARPAWWSGGGRGKRAKKGTYIGSVHPRVMYPYPASFARLKHLKHPSQSLPRITHQVLWLFLGGRGRPHAVGMLLPRTHDR